MANPQGVTWEWQKSTDLKTWLPATSDDEEVISNQGGEMSMRTAFDHDTGEALFYRLQVSSPSDPTLFAIDDLIYNGAFRLGPSVGPVSYTHLTLPTKA